MQNPVPVSSVVFGNSINGTSILFKFLKKFQIQILYLLYVKF